MSPGSRVNDAILGLVTLEHRVDPYFRDAFNAVLQRPLVDIVQFFLRVLHENHETELCQEILSADEAEIAAAITEQMKKFTSREYSGRVAERAGNTKT